MMKTEAERAVLRERMRRWRKENPEKNRENYRRWAANNPHKVSELNKKYYAANREKVRDSDLRRTYGMTAEQYAEMFAAQSGVCAICGKPENAVSRHGTPKTLSVDHDHQTGKVRKLLCHKCNTGLGAFRDNRALIQAADKYLAEHGVADGGY